MPRKKQYKIKYKKQVISDEFLEAVKETARITKVDVSTPEKLFDFYESRKKDFGKLFEIGVETSPKGTGTVFNEFDLAAENNNKFYFEEFGEQISITEKQAKFELAKLEQQLNVMFDSTGVEYSYKKKLDGRIIISAPTEEELELLQGEPVEAINDYLENFGIKIYTSDPNKKKKYESNKQRREKYDAKVVRRFRAYRKQYNAERKELSAKATKTKTNKKKR